MAYSQEIAWGDGTGDKIYFSAPASEGNQTVEISSDANGGSERTKTVNFNASGVSPQPLQIVQLAGGGGTDFDAWLKDGDTHLWINIVNDYQLAQEIRIKMIGTIDWGDGTTESVSATAYTTFSHTYSAIGKYRIDLKPTSGTFELGGANASYNVMGVRSNYTFWRTGVLYQVEVGSKQINTISRNAFAYLNGLYRVYVAKTITTVNQNTCNSCYALREFICEDSNRITSCILENNFYNCYNLQAFNFFPKTTETSFTGVVRSCFSLMEYTIPSTVTSIAASSLATVYSLKRLYCLPTSAPTAANANVFTSLPSDCSIKVPKGSLSSYQGATYWSTYSSQMSEAGAITFTLTSVTSSNQKPMADLNASYTTTLTPDTGKTLGTVTVKMGGVDITSTAYSAGVVTIANVTGNIEITATAS